MPIRGLKSVNSIYTIGWLAEVKEKNYDVRDMPFGFIRVKIIDHADWPHCIISYRFKDGSLFYSRLPSDVIRQVDSDKLHPRLFDEDGYFYISNYDLARLAMAGVKFQHAEGFVWGDMEEVYTSFITDFYQRRMEAKAAREDAKQNALKIGLNSSFGKTMQRSITERRVILNAELKDDGKYFAELGPSYYQEDVKVCDYLGGNQAVATLKSKMGESFSVGHESPVQIGSCILALSRWYMDWCLYKAAGFDSGKYKELAENRVYQDTDSFYQTEENAKAFEESGLYGKALGQFKNEVFPGRIIKFGSPGPKMKAYWVQHPTLTEEEYAQVEAADKEWDDPLKRREWKAKIGKLAQWCGRKWLRDSIRSAVEIKSNLKGYSGPGADQMIWDMIKHFEAQGAHTKWTRNYMGINTIPNTPYHVSSETVLQVDTALKLKVDWETKEAFVYRVPTITPVRNMEIIAQQWKKVLDKYEEIVNEFALL